MRKRWKLLSIALTFVLFSGLVGLFPVTAGGAENVFVQKEMTTYEGIYLEVKGKPSDNYRKVGVVLDEPMEIGENDFLSLSFRNLFHIASCISPRPLHPRVQELHRKQ